MGASEILSDHLVSTRFPSLTVEATLTTAFGGHSLVAKSRTLSRFVKKPNGEWEFAVMARITEGQPAHMRFLFKQQSTSAKVEAWFRFTAEEKAKKLPFVRWQQSPGSALRLMDFVITSPQSYTASLNPAAVPSDPGWQPPAECSVVDLALDPGVWHPEPRLIRMWIDNTPNRTVDHRVEQHLSNGVVRVIESQHWAQLPPGGPWGPGLRTVDDPVLEMRTTIVPDAADPAPLAATLFTSVKMATASF